MLKIISDKSIKLRKYWIEKIESLNERFTDNSQKIENELKNEINKYGINILIDHLRLCGNIPESYQHDSSEEKLYSKYTDCLISFAYREIGLKSIVLAERADSADVEVFSDDYSFVADAKAFRLSRTAKNQKDFKIQAMDGWKKGKKYAMLVCPIYQLPIRSSQIYQQASTHNVGIFTYSHLSLLLNYAKEEGKKKSEEILYKVFKTVSALNPSKNAIDYWLAINKVILNYSKNILEIWKMEKQAATESIEIAKKEGLEYLSLKRDKIMKMSHQEALQEIIKMNKIQSRINIINSISDNDLFSIN